MKAKRLNVCMQEISPDVETQEQNEINVDSCTSSTLEMVSIDRACITDEGPTSTCSSLIHQASDIAITVEENSCRNCQELESRATTKV